MPEEQRGRPHPNALPNYENAVMPREKMEGYALNSRHFSTHGSSHGKDKARVFKSVLGFNETNCEILRERILNELPYHEAVLDSERSAYGKAYRVDLPILGVNGNIATVRTAWLIRAGSDYPSLITLMVLI